MQANYIARSFAKMAEGKGHENMRHAALPCGVEQDGVLLLKIYKGWQSRENPIRILRPVVTQVS